MSIPKLSENLNNYFNNQKILELSTAQKEQIVKEHIEITRECAINILNTINWEFKKKAKTNIIEYLQPKFNLAGSFSKIYAVFYAAILIILSALILTGHLSFQIFGGLAIGLSCINLFLQGFFPYYALKRVKEGRGDPNEDLKESVIKEIRFNFNTPLSESLCKEKKLEHPPKTLLNKLLNEINEICWRELRAKIVGFGNVNSSEIPPEIEVTSKTSSSIIGPPEYVSLIHTLAIVLFVTLAWQGLLTHSLVPKLVMGTIPLSVVSSLLLQRTLKDRIIKPLASEQILDPKDAEKIKTRLIAKINKFCAL